MLSNLNELVKQVRINISDKRTTTKGVVMFIVGLAVLCVPLLPYTLELNVEQYSELIEYAKIVGLALCFAGLMLIGAIRSDNTNEKES